MNPFELDIADTLVRAAPAAADDVPLAEAQAWLARAGASLPPVRGTVFGVLLNDRPALEALGDAVNQPPYKAPPKAPVLYIKPRNTLCGHGDTVPVGPEGVLVGAALGLVIGRTVCRVAEQDALAHVAGYTVVNDLTVPHESFYRPALPCKARDRSCPMGPWVRARSRVANPHDLHIVIRVDGVVKLEASTSTFIRPAARLLADVSQFMTLLPGDVLLAGVPAGVPLAHAGQTVAVEIKSVGTLQNRLVDAGAFHAGAAS